MKKPVKNPPTAQENDAASSGGSVPSLEVQAFQTHSETNDDSAIPSLIPPVDSRSGDSDEGFGAGAWHNDKRVTALFSTNETRNSWMNIQGTGWLKLASNIDSANEALTVLASAAKTKNSPVNYYLDDGKVTQIYVW